MEREIIIKKVCLVLFLCVIFIFTWWRNTFFVVNSDFGNLVLEAQDILNGNFFRNDWNLTGISFLTTDLPYFIVGVSLFGVSNNAYILACTLMQLSMIIMLYILVKDQINMDNLLITGLLLISFAVMPNQFAVNILRAHTGGFVLSFFSLFLFTLLIQKKLSEKNRKIIIIINIAIIALSMMGDPIVLLLTVLPVCIWCVIALIKKEIDIKDFLKYIAINAIGIVNGFIFDKLYFLIGTSNKNSFLNTKTFISLDNLQEKIVVYIRSLLLMTDSSFENKIIVDINTVFMAINIVAVLIFFILLFYNIVLFFIGKEYDFITVILGMGFVIISLVCILTSIQTDVGGARYYGFFLALMVITYVRNIHRFKLIENLRLYYVVALCVLVVFVGRLYGIKNENKETNTEQLEIIRLLEDNNLKCGYASFWNASSLTVNSNDNVKVRAIQYDGNIMSMYNWFCKNSWYTEYANFIIVSNSDLFGLTRNNIVNILGEPSNSISSGNYEILVYNFDVSKYLMNGFSDNVVSAYEMYRNENVVLSDHRLEIYQNGSIWGPYADLTKGEYKIKCIGNNLSNLEYDVYSNQFGIIVERTGIADAYEHIISFDLNESVNDLEIRFYNSSEEPASFELLEIVS